MLQIWEGLMAITPKPQMSKTNRTLSGLGVQMKRHGATVAKISIKVEGAAPKPKKKRQRYEQTPMIPGELGGHGRL